MSDDRPRLTRGDLLPRMIGPSPGPCSRAAAAELAAFEAPGINTLFGGAPSLLWQEARGANVLDVDGNRYLDFTSGFGAALVGHRHPRVVAAVRAQAGRLLHGLGDVNAHPLRVRLAAALVDRFPGRDAAVYFAVSGADAVEIALETAYLGTGRPGVVAFSGAYHGLTLGARATSGRPSFRRPFAPYLHPWVRRLPFAAPPHQLEHLLATDPALGALLVEPIQGREGIAVPPPGWLAEVAALCRRFGVVLIADEILTGCGRTGVFFAVEDEGVEPDLLCCGKGLGGGLPLAAVVGRRDLLAAWPGDVEALHTATFVAHPLACAAALEVLSILDDEDLPGRARRLEARVSETLECLSGSGSPVAAVRGRGLLWGVELERPGSAPRVVATARERGLLLLGGGAEGRVVEALPSLSLSGRQLEAGLEILVATLTEAG